MKILALDISSRSTGFALFSNGLLQEAVGMIKLNHDTYGEKLAAFEHQLLELFELYKPDVVVAEEVWGGPSIKTFKVLVFFHGVMRNALFKWSKQEPIMIMPSEARKLISDKFKVSLTPKKIKKKGSKDKKKPSKDAKELTFDFIKKHFKFKDWEFSKHNDQTDAIALALAYSILNEENNGSL